MSNQTLMIGQTLWFEGDAMQNVADAARYHRRGGILIDGGKVADRGDADDLRKSYPQADVVDCGEGLILPGFVDAHMHYPQTRMIASWGKRLIDWLNTYTFPEEVTLADPAEARARADLTLDLALAHGTTTQVSYCTIHPCSVDAFFESAAARGMRVFAGKTCMDRNAPDGLRDTPQTAYDQSKELIGKWHGKGRAEYVITPRFSPTSTPEQLEALGALWAEHPNCLMQTHLSEQTDEIEWVKSLFPNAKDYLETYEQFGLLGERALYGHVIHMEPREMDRLAEVGAAVVHCPTSNTFIGSGVFEAAKMASRGIRVGLATDTGGGSSFSMLRTMAAAYEIGQLAGTALHPAQLLWLATEGSARALKAEDRIGTLAIGSEADITVLDLASTPAIAQRHARAKDIWEALFPTIMMGDDRAIKSVWVNGHPVTGE